MKTRLFLSLLLALSSGSAFAGIYQRARYTHAKVWNDQPKSFQEVTWSGAKDSAGYATGYGTLTCYAPEKAPLTGSNIPSRRRMVVVAQDSGTMVRGKFVGPMNANNATQATKSRAERNKTAPPASASARERTPSASVRESATPAPRATVLPASSPATSSSPTASPVPSVTATPAGDSVNSLTHPPSSLGLNTPTKTSPSPHPTPEASGSPSPP